MKPIGMRFPKLLQLHVALGLGRLVREAREQRALLHVLIRVETGLK
jgi:hypothetical protein